jgi:hypothetical protein
MDSSMSSIRNNTEESRKCSHWHISMEDCSYQHLFRDQGRNILGVAGRDINGGLLLSMSNKDTGVDDVLLNICGPKPETH